MTRILVISLLLLTSLSCSQNEKEIKQSELQGKSLQELRIMRNEIFARHGYIFKSDDLTNYFSAKDWYTPKFDDVNHLVTEIEKNNIAKIVQQEKLLKSNRQSDSSLEKIEFDRFVTDSLTEHQQKLLNEYLESNKSKIFRDHNNFWKMKISLDSYLYEILDQSAWIYSNSIFVSAKLSVRASVTTGGFAIAENIYLFRLMDNGLKLVYQTEFFQPECGVPDYNIIGIANLKLNNGYELIDLETEMRGCCGVSYQHKIDWLVFSKNSQSIIDTLNLAQLNMNHDHCSEDSLPPSRRETYYYYGRNSDLIARINSFEGDSLTMTTEKTIELTK